jgi:hypothetical protein
MKRIASLVLGSALVLLAASVLAARPQTGDREVEALMLAVKLLEEKPFDAKAKDVRAAAMKWIIDTDRVTVTVCAFLIEGIPERYPYASEMLDQYTIGMAAYKMSKETEVKTEDGAQLAGVESALTAYLAIVKERPSAKLAFLDDLVAMRTRGELAGYAQKNNCEKSRTAE